MKHKTTKVMLLTVIAFSRIKKGKRMRGLERLSGGFARISDEYEVKIIEWLKN